jgi:hypothetical protein
MAASMLRRGRDPHAVAKATKIPLALVALIDEELDTHRVASSAPPQAGHPSHRDRAGDDAAGADLCSEATPADVVHTQLHHASVRHARRRARIAVAALVGWVVNLGLSATAAIAHFPALGVASLILTPVLVVVLVLNAPTRAHAGPDPAGAHRRDDHTGDAAAPGHPL